MDALIAFVRSVLDHLPSSSAGTDKNPNVAAFGETLVDIVWSMDAELEDILADAKNAANAAEQGAFTAATVSQAVKAKENAESDKGTLVVVVRRLLVRVFFTVVLADIILGPAASVSWRRWLVVAAARTESLTRSKRAAFRLLPATGLGMCPSSVS